MLMKPTGQLGRFHLDRMTLQRALVGVLSQGAQLGRCRTEAGLHRGSEVIDAPGWDQPPVLLRKNQFRNARDIRGDYRSAQGHGFMRTTGNPSAKLADTNARDARISVRTWALSR